MLTSPCVLALPTRASEQACDVLDITQALRAINVSSLSGRLDIIHSYNRSEDNQNVIDVVVQLTWPPGVRRSRLSVTAQDPKTALNAFMAQVEARIIGPATNAQTTAAIA